MRAACIIILAVGGCGTDDVVQSPDAGVTSENVPSVMVTSPRANEAFYSSKAAQVTWIVTGAADASVECDVAASDGATTIEVATGVAATVGKEAGIDWPLAMVPVSTSYRVQLSCRDASERTGTAESEVFGVSGPPQAVSFAAQIRPLFETGCATAMCHDAQMPVAGLDLSASAPSAAMIGRLSKQCTATPLVAAGAPEGSYLVHKLQGTGPCFQRGRMPKGDMVPAFTHEQVQLVRDWIANGALDN